MRIPTPSFLLILPWPAVVRLRCHRTGKPSTTFAHDETRANIPRPSSSPVLHEDDKSPSRGRLRPGGTRTSILSSSGGGKDMDL